MKAITLLFIYIAKYVFCSSVDWKDLNFQVNLTDDKQFLSVRISTGSQSQLNFFGIEFPFDDTYSDLILVRPNSIKDTTRRIDDYYVNKTEGNYYLDTILGGHEDTEKKELFPGYVTFIRKLVTEDSKVQDQTKKLDKLIQIGNDPIPIKLINVEFQSSNTYTYLKSRDYFLYLCPDSGSTYLSLTRKYFCEIPVLDPLPVTKESSVIHLAIFIPAFIILGLFAVGASIIKKGRDENVLSTSKLD